MPQIDKVTFFTCVYTIFITYVFVYLDGQVATFFKFLTTMKFKLWRLIKIYWITYQRLLRLRVLLLNPWWTLNIEV